MAEYVRAGWGKLNFHQLKKGYRFSIDSVLLAAFVQLKGNARILEAGSGEGVIPVLLTLKNKPFTYTGIEIQSQLCQLARKNLEINNIDGEIICGDWKNPELVEAEKFDIGIVNPPYYKLGTGRRNPDPLEEIARHEVKGDIKSALRFLTRGVKKRGKIFIIYPAARLATMIEAMLENKVHPKILLPVYSSRKSVAKFILCQGIKEGGEETKLLPPLHIFKDPARKIYTHEMKEIMEKMDISFKK